MNVGHRTLSIPAGSLSIPGVMLFTPRKHFDERGYFVETYNRESLAKIGITCAFVQDNLSYSIHRGTVRGLHFQSAPWAQAKLVRVACGSVYDVVVDVRRGSPTYGRWCGTSLSAADGQHLFIPVGFAHAYCTLEPETIVSYKVDAHYAKTSEGGLRWDDPDLAIDWPISSADARVSEKDRNLPRLRDFSSPFVF